MKACPFNKFANETSRNCLPCAYVCANSTLGSTCTGPLAEARRGGCNRCFRVVAVGPPICYDKQPSVGFYAEPIRRSHFLAYPHLKGFLDPKLSILLFPCDVKCETCHGPGPKRCGRCRQPFFKDGISTCTKQCPKEGKTAHGKSFG